jgi:hypothetical protein
MSMHTKKDGFSSPDSERSFGNLSQSITEARGSGGILVKLWRTILKEEKVDVGGRLQSLLTDYVFELKSGAQENRYIKTVSVGNLRREFERPTMTMKVFLKGLKMLKPKRVTFTVGLTWRSGKHSTYSTEVDLGALHFTESEDDESPATKEAA